MALTVGCARCHDHKFDPIPQADYYSMAGIFKSSKTMENFKVVAKWHEYVDRKSTRLNSSHSQISYAVFCLKKKKKKTKQYMLNEKDEEYGGQTTRVS